MVGWFGVRGWGDGGALGMVFISSITAVLFIQQHWGKILRDLYPKNLNFIKKQLLIF